MKNPVGPILRMGDEVEQVIAAIEDDNPDTDIEVIDRGAYVRVQGEDRITVTEQTLRRYLGADFEIASFGAMMSAFSGRAITSSDGHHLGELRPPGARYAQAGRRCRHDRDPGAQATAAPHVQRVRRRAQDAQRVRDRHAQAELDPAARTGPRRSSRTPRPRPTCGSSPTGTTRRCRPRTGTATATRTR